MKNLILSIFALSLLTTTSNAGDCTHDYEKMVKILNKQFGETKKFMALANNGNSLIETFISKDGYSFTIIATGLMPKRAEDGKISQQTTSCIIAAGKNWIQATEGTPL